MVNNFLEIPGQCGDYDMDSLELDQAFLSVNMEDDIEGPLYIYGLNSDCRNVSFI